MGGCQNSGPILGTLDIRGLIIMGTQKGTIILTTTQILLGGSWALVTTWCVGRTRPWFGRAPGTF